MKEINQRPINTDSNVTYYFLNSKGYSLATPNGFASSERTIDIPFHDLANNYDLQEKLNMLSRVLIEPDVLPPLAYPLEGEKLIEGVAIYLAAFCDDPKERKQRREYLINNGLVRVLITNDVLLEKVREITQSLA